MHDKKVLGIIVEYNPLHNGHVYHFREAKKKSGAEAVVAVMSGPFLQRGEPAFVSKWARTEMALQMGVDLVIELPVAYSCQPAEWFAYGAVSALEATGIVGRLCFGSESGEIDWMLQLARRLSREPEPLQEELKRRLKSGMNFPRAYSESIAAIIGKNENLPVSLESLSRPNNTLGLHYLIALERLQSRIEPLTITRKKAEYDQSDISDHHIASATAIRRLIDEGGLERIRPFVPEYTFEILHREFEAGRAPIRWDHFYDLLLHQILSKSEAELRSIYEVNEGLERRILKQLPLLNDHKGGFEALVEALKSKRYTRTKLQRTLLRILLNHSKNDLSMQTLAGGTPYLRILGMSETGKVLLKRMKKTAKVPVVQQPAHHRSPFLELDLRASAIYALAYRDAGVKDWFRDYYEPPLRFNGGSVAR